MADKCKEMTDKCKNITVIFVYIIVNALFVWKYVSRAQVNPVLSIIAWIFVLAIVWMAARRWGLSSESRAKWYTFALITIIFSAIAFLLFRIDPLSVNVDRWSALEYFLDSLFEGSYPYGVETHMGNHPSPFPLWHYLHIPFYWLGDMGFALFVYLAVFLCTIWLFSRSWRTTLIPLLLLMLSPAYWWEVVVRSDGLGNAMLIFCVILWMEHRQCSFQNHLLEVSVLCGMVAMTRLSAFVPFAIYVARSFLRMSIYQQLASFSIILAIVLLFFSPYVFWNTETWVFFSCNPLMTQTQLGSPLILIVMMAIAFWLIIKHNNSFIRYTNSTACFLFIFFLSAIVSSHVVCNADTPWMEDASFDISYLTLSLPYCLLAIALNNQPISYR